MMGMGIVGKPDMPNCMICRDESGGEFVGVAAIPAVPMSVGWCTNCKARDFVVPTFIAEYWVLDCGEGDPTDPFKGLQPWVPTVEVWHNGGYMTIRDYIKEVHGHAGPEQ